MTFDDSFNLVIGSEGGYTDNRADPGNWTGGRVGVGEMRGTKYGIAANSHPKLDIKNLTIAAAKSIYISEYWKRLACDKMPGLIAYQVFDMGVNMGVGTAAKVLQRCLGVTVDGSLGPITLGAVSKVDPLKLSLRLCGARISYYTDLATWGTFGKGWMNRIADILEVVGK